jgi:hypothetical protein
MKGRTEMNRVRMWAGLLAVFACGLAIGAVSGSLYQRQLAAERYNQIRRDKGAFLTALVMKRLEGALELNQKQKAGIQPLLLEGFRRSLKVREEVRPRQEEIIRETTGRIRTLLTPQQVQKLQQSGDWELLLPRPPNGHH